MSSHNKIKKNNDKRIVSTFFPRPRSEETVDMVMPYDYTRYKQPRQFLCLIGLDFHSRIRSVGVELMDNIDCRGQNFISDEVLKSEDQEEVQSKAR